ACEGYDDGHQEEPNPPLPVIEVYGCREGKKEGRMARREGPGRILDQRLEIEGRKGARVVVEMTNKLGDNPAGKHRRRKRYGKELTLLLPCHARPKKEAEENCDENIRQILCTKDDYGIKER